MKVIIAGGGIGGLTTALCLGQDGHEVTVLEQAPLFEAVGAGLQCGANALRVFQSLGLEDALEQVSVDPSHIDFLHFRSGQLLNRMQFGEAYRQKYGAAYLHIHRADLHQVLLDAIASQPAISLLHSHQVTAYQEYADRVRVSCANGKFLEADCLIGCDGVRSNVRAQLLGQQYDFVEPSFTGNVAWRAVVPRDRLPENFMDKQACNFVGHNKHAVIYYLRKQQLVNFVGVVKNPDWREDSWVVKSPWEELQSDFEGWHPRVQQLINAMDKDACYRWALYTHAPLPRWSSDRVTLLGDAAHSTLPFMASGAAMAIEDARIVARCLVSFDDTRSALQAYQRARLPRTTKIQSGSEKMGKIYHLKSGLTQRAAFWLMRKISKKPEAMLASYDANTVALP